MYKTFAKHLLAIAFVIYLVAAIITALLALAGGTVGILLGSFVSVVAAFVLQATLVKAVQDVRDGHADLSIRQTVNEALPFLAPVAGASILAGIAITIGLLLIIVPGLFLITIWAVIVPVIIIERSGALASFGRSRALVRGHGWHVFGTLVLVYIIMLVVNIVLGLIFSALPRRARRRPELGHLRHPDLPVPRARGHARVLPAGRHLRARGRRPGRRIPAGLRRVRPAAAGRRPVRRLQPAAPGWRLRRISAAPAGWRRLQPAAPGWRRYGGYNPPPQGGGGYGGYNQPPQGGSEPPTQRVPRQDGWEPPAQPPR